MSSGQQVDTSNCTEVTPECPVSATLYGDYFSTGACAFFVAAYGLAILAQIYLAWKSKAWSYAAYLAVGSTFELIGYAGRLIMSFNPFVNLAFILQILFLILAPTLVAAAISLTFKHLVLYFGPQHSTIRPRLYPWVFVGTDFVSIVIQGIGGAVAASGSVGENPDPEKTDLGNNLLIAGVSFQVVNMVVCGLLMLIYIRRYRVASKRGVPYSDTQFSVAHRDQDQKVQRFIWSIVVAYVAIIVRCIYRYVLAYQT